MQVDKELLPEDKIRSRYEKALQLIPRLVEVCDILHIYDNADDLNVILKAATIKEIFVNGKMALKYYQ